LLATAADLPLLCTDIPRVAWRLIDRYWPGPLTLVLPARPSVSPRITAMSGTVAVRVPAAHTCLRLLETLGVPLVGTSANRSGRPPANTAQGALEELGADIDAVLEDDVAVAGGPASTVVSLTGPQPVIHRRGAISADAVRAAAGARVLVQQELTVPRSSG
jgi:L-threonylcarbamoyladenylate synthase